LSCIYQLDIDRLRVDDGALDMAINQLTIGKVAVTFSRPAGGICRSLCRPRQRSPDNDRLGLDRRHSRHTACFILAVLKKGMGDMIAQRTPASSQWPGAIP
jgi:hypothetical protein